ncbi:MAG: ABC transporter ATP-binding protein [Roseibacillus sp.]|nr:ABC transporter ATP-binding protein [Roseibacillus sp.]MBP36000.1 ABC transporter ATP-binding protein [Roseibacillus sp.]MCP4730877.1 ATP-binding cassette domain-containing protein [Roseibacillus sp.]MDP7105798.1 ATP-binding cassette domain-containing protein [Roseibacillus sp.]MDP7306293.1 ATP-binding cassette domain-containing protein [Roseibacillus sp.]|tara:strand:- start:3965 stop:4762 length:798 start_codon:yes stop_codon:yes gene_type:complete
MSKDREVFIEVRNLHQRFGRHRVLRGVDLKVYRGETLCILGGSGGGKSVLVKHLCGLMRPWKGSVIVEGEDITNLPERALSAVRRKVSMMFQGGALFDSFTVEQNIAFPLREAGLRDQKEIELRVRRALKIVRMSGQEKKMPADLSGGMRKRVALARAVVEMPACVLYDEPHAGLDPITSDSIDHLIRDLRADHKVTNVVITHELRSVFRIADRVAFMKEGVIYWEGPADELAASKDPELLNFVQGRSETLGGGDKDTPRIDTSG